VVDRLRHSADESSLVGSIANRRDDSGALLDRQLVVANLRLLVLAGHETTAAALAWNMLHLADSPADQQRALDELEGDADPMSLSTDRERFTFAEAQFREALRLYPAVHSVIRRIQGDLRVGSATVPNGTLLNVPLLHLLRDPHRFAHPDRYQPSRWSARPRPGTIETAMFGGGPHFCLGYHLAIAEGTLFNLHLAHAMRKRRVRLRRAGSAAFPHPIYLPLSHPPRGQSVRFEASS
jgi:cytochrome P450 monooxygenase